jgi:type I restriction enzyme S subunit
MNYSKYNEYKNTGIEWLGKIPTHWNNWRLSKIANFRRGSFPQPYGLDKWYDDENGMPFIQVFDVDNNMRLKSKTKRKISKEGAEKSVFIKKGTLILTIQGSIGRIAITQYDAYIDRTLLIFQSYNVDLDVDFFKHIITVLFEFEEKKAVGSTIKTINKEKLSRFIIPIPPKEEQTTIANFLDYKTEKINRFIKKKKQLIKVLNEQKSTITIQAVTKGLDPNVRMKNSGTKWLGNVPEHWEVKKLKYVANCFPSNVDKHSLEDEKEVRLCNYTDVYKNDFITNNMELMIATAKDDQIQKFALKKGDVIITKDSETADDIANPALVIEDLENVICGYHLSIMRPYSKLKGEYLLRALQCKPINVQFELCSNGVTRVGLGVADMKKAQIPLPPIEEQNDISSFIQSELNTINKTISTIEKEITLVEEYKTALIAEAVTGKIDVRDFKIPTGGTPLAMVAEEAINYKRVNKNE